MSLIPRSVAAQRLGRHPQTLLRWAADHYGPSPVSIRNRWMYEETEIENFINKERRRVAVALQNTEDD